MIRCVFCGTENDEIFTYCLNCGKPLEQSMQTFKARTPASGTVESVKLIVVKSDGTDGASFPLKSGENVVGRGPVDIDLGADPRIAAKHAMIDVGKDVAFITGIDTEFGTFIRIRDTRVLADHDRVRIGHALLEYRAGLQRTAAPAADCELLGSSAAATSNVYGRVLRMGPNNTVLGAWLLNKPETMVGRTTGDIVLNQDGFVSSRHAIFAISGNECALKDQNSTNGSFLMVRGRVAISNGDQVLIGPHLLRFQRG
jgi:pSer/pThr/pTyr-binding forkhead associated (FHA) protein